MLSSFFASTGNSTKLIDVILVIDACFGDHLLLMKERKKYDNIFTSRSNSTNAGHRAHSLEDYLIV